MDNCIFASSHCLPMMERVAEDGQDVTAGCTGCQDAMTAPQDAMTAPQDVQQLQDVLISTGCA